MNRAKKFIHKDLAKKMHKEIRLAQSAYPVKEELLLSNEAQPAAFLKKYPKKMAKKWNEQIESLSSHLKKTKKKRSFHVSKRTTPGELLSRDAAPAHIHKEGTRWSKTLVAQAQGKRRYKAK